MSRTAVTQYQFFSKKHGSSGGFRSGVSLHSHTMYSEESLAIVPRLIRAILGIAATREGYWTPPLAPRQAYQLEQKQIEERFHLPGLISLTDHDDIRAGALLRMLDGFRHTPVSTEWTVPFGSTFFHFGVHHLRPSDAFKIMNKLRQITSKATTDLKGALEMLNADPNVLLVLNHPLWDEKKIGRAQQERVLRELLAYSKQHIHALEANGFRPWRENEQVIRIGCETNLPVVAGGDRHGLEPNALLNLSRATTMRDFVEEVRRERFSHIVVMPQYRRCRSLRILEMARDAIRNYPECEGRERWRDRVYCRQANASEPGML